MFQVDGISYNVLVPFGGLKRSFEIKEGTGSLTYIDGDYDRDVVGTYYNYEVQIDKKGSDQEDYGTECGEDREFCGAHHSRSGQCAGNHCADVYHLLLLERVDGGYLCGLHRL